jgi:hypothetical protein
MEFAATAVGERGELCSLVVLANADCDRANAAVGQRRGVDAHRGRVSETMVPHAVRQDDHQSICLTRAPAHRCQFRGAGEAVEERRGSAGSDVMDAAADPRTCESSSLTLGVTSTTALSNAVAAVVPVLQARDKPIAPAWPLTAPRVHRPIQCEPHPK